MPKNMRLRRPLNIHHIQPKRTSMILPFWEYVHRSRSIPVSDLSAYHSSEKENKSHCVTKSETIVNRLWVNIELLPTHTHTQISHIIVSGPPCWSAWLGHHWIWFVWLTFHNWFLFFFFKKWHMNDFCSTGGPLSNRLQKVSLEITNQSSCESAYPNKITSAQFCTYTNGKDTCNSDSGGPLMYTTNTTGVNLLYQIGVTSYGLYCASSSPSVNTKVAAYLDWIINEARSANFCIPWTSTFSYWIIIHRMNSDRWEENVVGAWIIYSLGVVLRFLIKSLHLILIIFEPVNKINK